MNPLESILIWWKTLEDFPRGNIAVEISLRLLEDSKMEQCETRFQEFLSEHLTARLHIGRTIVVRSIIDFMFTRDSLDDPLKHHLDTVETADPESKAFANAAVGRHMRIAGGIAAARDSWRTLRATEISDTALISLERNALLDFIYRTQSGENT
jgi:hypothetical protein